MKTILAALSLVLLSNLLHAAGFSDGNVMFYGEVRQVGGAQTVLLQSGTLEMTFVNQSNPTNVVKLTSALEPTGSGTSKPYSYALQVPLAYLPEAPRMGEYLAIGSQKTNFRITSITIGGVPATLPDGSKEFYGLSFANRSEQYRLDLLVAGNSTDTDGDGLPDWWEKLYGLNHELADADSDFDNDGWSNLEEFHRGSNPAVSNREPQLATTEIVIPEAGEAGVYLHILDSDSEDNAIHVTLTGIASGGFEIKLGGVRLPPGEQQQVSLTDLRSGRLSITQKDRALHQFPLPLTWSDGGEVFSGQVLVRAVSPSTSDGNDSSLWLDGMDLTNTGGRLATWPDRSGNNRPATQPLPAHQPLVTGHAADFSKAKTAHLFFQDAALPTGDHTVLAAYRPAASADTARTLLSTNRGFMEIAPTSQAVSYPGAPTYQMNGASVRGFENSAGADTTSIFRREGSLLENIFGLSYDGESIAAAAIDPVLPTLGARRSAIPSGSDPVDQSFGGQLQELLVFPAALPEQKLRDVHDYLQSKWSGAVIWDLSTGLKPVSLAATSGTQRQILRGGHGADHLGGGPLADTLSGGPGADILTGGGGMDRFVFGGVDTGTDHITDYNLQEDVIDLSALFWGKTGDARQFISIRLDTDFSTEIPTLSSVLIVQVPGSGTQEIVLENRVLGATQLIQLIGEGRIRMGGLSIPSGVQVALASGAPADPTQPFNIIVTRSGAGVAAALDVPLGFFDDALGGHFIVDGATSNESQRSVIHFARNQTSKTLTVRPMPDLDTTGPATVQVAVLPQYKYSVGGTAVLRTVSDKPNVWLEVVEANAVSGNEQPAVLRIHRDGSLSQSLTVDLNLGGTAKVGVHILSIPVNLTIPAGQSSAQVQITALAAGLANGPKVVLFQLVPREIYQLGDPREAMLYAAATIGAANGAGFDRWLQASTHGAMTTLADLAGAPRETVDRYLQAYAFGLGSVDELGKQRVDFRIVNGRPEISASGTHKAADVRWGVESTRSLGQWTNASGKFSEATDPAGLKLVGDTLNPADTSRFYRLSMNLDPGVLASSSLAALTHATRTGISGNAAWKTDQASGDLVSSGSSAGEISRIMAEVGGTETLDFEMKIAGGGTADSLVFYIDGVKQSETSGASVRFQQTLTGNDPHLLVWEFKRGSGNAVIRNRAP
ncbi:MAG: type I secretion C-terminal target domain-containing protein [Verrucomicrobiota bacterium]